MSPSRLCRGLVAALVVLVATYWLFADTVRHWRRAELSGNEIRLSYWGGSDDHQMWQEVIQAFESRHAGLRVRAEWLPLSGYSAKIAQELIAGDAPDIMMFQDEPFPRYAAEQFAPLDDLMCSDEEMQVRLADCWPTAPASFQFAGSFRGVPVMGGNVLIFCNRSAFERASRFHQTPVAVPSPDWTLDDFVDLCRRLTIDEDGDGRIDQFGFMQPHWVYYLPFIWAYGAEMTDPDRTRWTLAGPQALAALAMYADLRHLWRVTPMPSEFAGQNSDTAFLSGRVAMCVNGPWFQPFLRETALAEKYSVLPIPRGPGGGASRVTWDGLCMYAKLPPTRRDSAWRFLRFALTEEAQNIFAAHQRAIPARRACADAYVRSSGGEGSPAEAFVAAMKEARLQPITPAWHLVNMAMTKHLTSLLLDGEARRTPEQALAALAADPAIVQAFRGGSR